MTDNITKVIESESYKAFQQLQRAIEEAKEAYLTAEKIENSYYSLIRDQNPENSQVKVYQEAQKACLAAERLLDNLCSYRDYTFRK